MKAVRIKVTGRVQGVFFRANTREKAQELGVKGWVSNQPDGSVLIEAEAAEGSLSRFISWCRQGPPMSHVDQCRISDIEVSGLTGFEIKR